jgi:hypothetical protein
MGGATFRSMFAHRRREPDAPALPAVREVSPTPPSLPAALPAPAVVVPVGFDA